MTEKHIGKELMEIQRDLHAFDTIVGSDFRTGETTLNDRQVAAVRKLLSLFESLNWQIALNSYRELKIDHRDSIRQGMIECGAPVKVRSCRKEHGDKTYFGIFIGEIPLGVGASIDAGGNLTVRKEHYNPAIFVPELRTVLFGAESWWGEIKSEEELSKMITDETIQNVWYVRALAELSKKATTE